MRIKVLTSPLKVAVAMSGGVDSSVAAALLVEAGHTVVGFTLKLWDAEEEEHSRKVCCTTVMARDAGSVCEKLGIPHYTLDLRESFQREVIDPFETDYLAGRTPNPCVRCNRFLKWGALCNKARLLGLDYIATGHYARVIHEDDGGAHLLQGADTNKDQTYFLWSIPPALLSKTLFPLGEMTKDQVRSEARRFGLSVADKVESQEVCFVPRDDYRGWLFSRHPDLAKGNYAGTIVDSSGNEIGQHPGYPYFTIGQRRGLGLGGGQTLFVTSIDPKTRRVTVGAREDLRRDRFALYELNCFEDALEITSDLSVRIRYRDRGTPVARIERQNGHHIVHLGVPIEAITPGQSAVFYRGKELVAGGIIGLD
ncbi:MAG: tRNA 2-thiouridine(34) synthase MnmA [Calditrichaeota bacterium]|nr:tRNA 2-thiouridine(34) synthase MnmA [Calditrichota bacterium]